jgi:hypothetical protein
LHGTGRVGPAKAEFSPLTLDWTQVRGEEAATQDKAGTGGQKADENGSRRVDVTVAGKTERSV